MKAILFFIFMICSTFAQTKDDFSHLKQFGGDYYSDQVLDDAKVNPILKKMMGKEYKHLRENLSVTGAVDVISGDLVIQGNADHKGGEEMGIFVLNLYSGLIRTAILSNGKITIYCSKASDEYFKSTDFDSLPYSIKTWVAVVNYGLDKMLQKPANVTMK